VTRLLAAEEWGGRSGGDADPFGILMVLIVGRAGGEQDGDGADIQAHATA
jgi:hypothetical protein